MGKGRIKKLSDSEEFFIKFVNGKETNRPKLVHSAVYKWWRKDDKEQRKVEILEVRLTLMKLLYQIIYHQQVLNSKEIQYFIKICDEHIINYKVKNGIIDKGYELAPSSKFKSFTYPPWLRDLSFNLIYYLSDPNNDIRKIKQCERCKDFFISKRVNKRTKYCPLCSPKNKMSKEQRKVYDSELKVTKKRAKDNSIRSEYISRLISAGCSKEEAEKDFNEVIKPELSTE